MPFPPLGGRPYNDAVCGIGPPRIDREPHMNLEEEMQRIPELSNIGLALVQFTKSLADGHFVRSKSKSWVYEPLNFVAIAVQYARAKSIALSLYGNWRDFREDPVLPISGGRNTMWVRCIIDSPRQIAAASRYIEKAFIGHSQSPRQAWKYKLSKGQSGASRV